MLRKVNVNSLQVPLIDKISSLCYYQAMGELAQMQKGGENMNRTAQTAQRKAKGLKILECTVEEDVDLRFSHYSYLACGSGGGCSGGYDRATRAARMQRTL